MDFTLPEFSLISPQARALLAKMLDTVPENRPSAEECLGADFFFMVPQETNQVITVNAVKTIKKNQYPSTIA